MTILPEIPAEFARGTEEAKRLRRKTCQQCQARYDGRGRSRYCSPACKIKHDNAARAERKRGAG